MNIVEEKIKNNFPMQTNKRYVDLSREKRKNNLKNIVEKINNLIIKKFKLNVNCHIKIGRNHNLLQI
jgi:hypothetical protein